MRSVARMRMAAAARDAAELAAVTAYLAGVGVLLRASGRLRPSISLPLLAARTAQLAVFGRVGPRAATLRALRHERGRAFVAGLPPWLGAPSDAEGGSPLVLLEDGRPLGPRRPALDEVAGEGGGRWYHWFNAVVFSTSDGTDPRSNGRRYEVRVDRPRGLQ